MSESLTLIGQKNSIEIGKAKVVDHQGYKVAVFRAKEDEFYAIDDVCPHQAGPLSEGYLDGYNVRCPWHAWDFDVRTGACDTVDAMRIKTFKIKLDGDQIFLNNE
ncbi:MAG: nitrite reductase (NADH) small subunit [Candidatus Omnitrophota bacterium]|jgi:nitrite reductase (NADH) small subunit